MKVKVAKRGLPIPKEVTDRLGSEEVEIFEEPGRLLISPAGDSPVVSPGRLQEGPGDEVGSILSVGADPVDDEVTDASADHDR